MSDISPLQHFLVLSNAALHLGRRAEFIPCSLGLPFITGTKKKKSWIYENSDAFVLVFKSFDLWVTSLTERHVFRGTAGWFVGGLGFIHHLAGWGWRLRPSTRALRKTWYKT